MIQNKHRKLVVNSKTKIMRKVKAEVQKKKEVNGRSLKNKQMRIMNQMKPLAQWVVNLTLMTLRDQKRKKLEILINEIKIYLI